ncbi:MAG TPA: HEPN domain-containing protein [Candidatus Gastranaerophilales bacterium]|nr:HEPN domain-containing protein [Candidatus Gastranaerophilales bacterium]
MIFEQSELILKAKESVKAAKILLNDQLYDFAISRAYYSMFYIAEAFLLGENLSFSKHSAVISAIGSIFVKTGKIPSVFHKNLTEAFNKRSAGDYETDTGFTDKDALDQIIKAEEFINFAERIIK